MIGRVVKTAGTWNLIEYDNKTYSCRLKGKLKLNNIKSTNPIAVGDYVEFELDNEQQAIIDKILPRNNYIIRKSVNLSKNHHIIAANLDIAFFIYTYKNPQTTTGFLDRFLVTCEAYNIPITILFSKIDELSDEEIKEIDKIQELYKDIGYSTLKISTLGQIGLDHLRELLKNKTSVFFGHSGVGKSTLINHYMPHLNLKTQEISETHAKGQHTTTFAQMYTWDFEGKIIGIPGIKEFGLIEIEKNELQDYFPEILKYKNECKFYNCLHINEPNCTIKEKVEDNLLSKSRYKSYLKMIEDTI